MRRPAGDWRVSLAVMKIACFLNTSGSINWGCQATFEGVRHLLMQAYPEAEFVPLDLPPLSFRRLRPARRWLERRLGTAILNDNEAAGEKALARLNVSTGLFDACTHICFNGEGAVHYRSGHLMRCMGLLYLLSRDRPVVAINQTIDLGNDAWLERVVAHVYRRLERVSVREPMSLRYARGIGIDHAELVPDTVYGLPRMDAQELARRAAPYALPERYLTMTGSSALRDDRSSLCRLSAVAGTLLDASGLPVVFMASAKADIRLAARLARRYPLTIIQPPVRYLDAMAIIARSGLLAGGRQHPNIFAWMYAVPYLPFAGNTFKNSGVAELQHYPLVPLPWNADAATVRAAWEKAVALDRSIFHAIPVGDFRLFG